MASSISEEQLQKLAKSFMAELKNIKDAAESKKLLKNLYDNWSKANSLHAPPMHWASGCGNLEFLEALLKAGADVNEPNPENSFSPLMYTTSPEVIKLLINNKANINYKNKNGDTVYNLAVLRKSVPLLKFLIETGETLNPKGDFNSALLTASAANASLDIIEYLLLKGINVNYSNGDGYSALMYASRHGFSKIVSVLLNSKADVNQVTTTPINGLPIKTTALMRASANGQNTVIHQLLYAGADVNAIDGDGDSALVHSLENNKFIAASILLSYGAQPNAKAQKLINEKMKLSQDELLALMSSTKKYKEHQEMQKFIKNINLAKNKPEKKKVLEEFEASWNENIQKTVKSKSDTALPPLRWCIENNHVKGIHELIKAGIDPNAVKIEEMSPLLFAMKMKKTAAFEGLLLEGADTSELSNSLSKLNNLDAQFSKILDLINAEVQNHSEIVKAIADFVNCAIEMDPKLLETKKINKKYIEDIENKIFHPDFDYLKNLLNPIFIKLEKEYSLSRNYISVDKNESLEKTDNFGSRTPLTWAIKNKRFDMVRALIKNGADVNERDAEGDTPLCLCVKSYNNAMLQLLLNSGADINKDNQNGYSPLLVAMRHMKIDNALFLIQSGADVFKLNKSHKSALELLINNIDELSDIDHIESVTYLIKELNRHGVDLDNTLVQGAHPLAYVLTLPSHPHTKIERAKSLIASGLNINKSQDELQKIIIEPEVYAYLLANGLYPGYAQDKKLIKKVGHGIGLSETMLIPAAKTAKINNIVIQEPDTIQILTEGEQKGFGISLTKAKLEKYQERLPSLFVNNSPFFKINKAFEFSTKRKNNIPMFNSAKDLNEHYHSNKHDKDAEITIVPSGFWEHAVSVALYKNKLIITNRGEGGDLRFGAKIYNIIEPSRINESFFQSLINNCVNKEGKDHFPNLFNGIVDLNQPIAQFPSKAQKHGTCDFVNQKSSIEPFLYLLKLDEGVGDKQALDYARMEYKRFTTFIREDEINYIIQKISEKAEVDPIIFELVKAVLIQHHEAPEKSFEKSDTIKIKNTELARASRLFSSIPENYQKKLKELAKTDNNLQEALNVCEQYKIKTQVLNAYELSSKKSHEEKVAEKITPPITTPLNTPAKNPNKD